jgi:hypothetical protein
VVVPPGRRTIAPASTAVPTDRSRGRGNATLVEASVTAHLLGLRLLTLDAKVALVPADVTVAASPRTQASAAHAPVLPAGNARGRAEVARGRQGLADAVRNLREGARLLAEVQQRDGS